MYWKTVISIVLFISIHKIQAQDVLPLHDIKFSHEIEEGLENGTLNGPGAAYYYTYIGQYEKSLETYELHLDWGMDTMSWKDSLYLLGFEPVNAVEYITKRAENEQIIMISEAHQKPQHRILTRLLLSELYKKEYRYLGIEALTPSYEDSTLLLMDASLNSRGYPLNSPLTGTLTREPQMANLVREALEIGFEVFGYERGISDLERDLKQALNIDGFMKTHPNGKVLIHCGWYHAIESD